ncbi:MAG: (d)CMP kinase [Anaerolineae bacterium]|nr:(d)CMP kinase [Anaerolineae bacterium]
MGIPATIAIDGPAASGKSTVGYYLACELGYLYLDTGALYRAVTWAALERHIPITDEDQVTTLAESLDIEVLPNHDHDDGRQYTIRVWEQDVTWALRTPEVDHAVSPVSTYAGVREALTQRMREIGARGCVVMVGRDIGTVVLPDADLKLYIIASAEERAHRRHLDRLAQGEETGYDDVLSDIRRRDRIDSSRDAAPLRAAPDALIFDTTELSIEDMFERVLHIVRHAHRQPEPFKPGA